jgi:NTP pyrophosphatase (non-canonical NTP hydrolase)
MKLESTADCHNEKGVADAMWEKVVMDDHAALVAALIKPGEDMQAEMSARDMELVHMAIGVAGEAGELLDAVKKHTIYRKPLDVGNVVEELGDLEFFLAGVRKLLNIDRSTTLRANIAKLKKRYDTLSYSNAAAIARADKQPDPFE